MGVRRTAAPALAAATTLMVMTSCAALAQDRGLLDELFGNSDRLSTPSGRAQPRPSSQPPAEPGQVAQAPSAELSVRVERLESQIRQLTGVIEQLQYRNQQLEAQL